MEPGSTDDETIGCHLFGVIYCWGGVCLPKMSSDENGNRCTLGNAKGNKISFNISKLLPRLFFGVHPSQKLKKAVTMTEKNFPPTIIACLHSLQENN